MTRPHSQISSMIKLYGQASANANKLIMKDGNGNGILSEGECGDRPVDPMRPSTLLPHPRVSVCLFMINYTHHSRHLPRAGQPGCHALHWRAGNLWDGPLRDKSAG